MPDAPSVGRQTRPQSGGGCRQLCAREVPLSTEAGSAGIAARSAERPAGVDEAGRSIILAAMKPSATPAPLELHRESVLPEWTDYNGHMNLAYYVLAFDHATDRLFDHLGLGHAYRLRTDHSLFTLEAHVSYARELNAGDALRFTTQLVAYDAKRIHYFHAMYHADEGYLAATNELLSIHVSLSARRASAMPAAALARLERLMAEHAALPRPPQLGRVIAIPRKG